MPIERGGAGPRNSGMPEARERGVDDGGRGHTDDDEGVVREEADGEVFGMFLLRVAAGVVRPVEGGRRWGTVPGGEREGLSVQGGVGADVRRVAGEARGRGSTRGGGDEGAGRAGWKGERNGVVRRVDQVGRNTGEPDLSGVCVFSGVGGGVMQYRTSRRIQKQ